MSELHNHLSNGVYFLSPEGLLTHNAGCLMEGLLDLDVSVYTNAKQLTSRQVSMPLKGHDLSQFYSEAHPNFSAYVVDITHANTHVPLTGLNDKLVAYLTTSDSSAFCRIPDEHLLLSTHENRFAAKGGARHPVAFGPSNWLIAQTEKRGAFADRDQRVLRNFRPTLSQGVRAMLDLSYVPLLEQHISIDSTIHSPGSYLKALGSASACLAYGGDFYAPIMQNPWFKEHQPDTHSMHDFERVDHNALVLRWDSWRLWEALLSGCVAIHLDFEKYGFDLPVRPKAWTHYVPIDLDDVKGSVEAFMDRQSDWADISEQGRAWAIQHYAPQSVAQRCFDAMLQHHG